MEWAGKIEWGIGVSKINNVWGGVVHLRVVVKYSVGWVG